MHPFYWPLSVCVCVCPVAQEMVDYHRRGHLPWGVFHICWFQVAWHSQTHNLLYKCIYVVYESGVKSIHSVVYRIKTIIASRSCASLVR